jgi:hypothetical protein
MRGLIVFIFFCGSFFLMSCEKPGLTPGGNLLPESDALSAFQTDTFSVVVETQLEDSVKTDELSLAVLGRLEDDELGMSNFHSIQTFCIGSRISFSDGNRLSCFSIGV